MPAGTPGARPDTGDLCTTQWEFRSDGRASKTRHAETADGAGALEVVCGSDREGVLLQDLPGEAEAYRSNDYVFRLWVCTDTPGAVRLSVDDGISDHQWTDPSSGSSDWECLLIDGIVSHRATRLRPCIHVAAGCRALLRGARFEAAWVPALEAPSLEDLTEEIRDEDLPRLDRRILDESDLTTSQRFWREQGYLILPRFLPDELVDAYCCVRENVDALGGYDSVNPYRQVEEIKALCLYAPLMATLEELIGEPMGMHLNLTGWISTERNWHQDDYLNPPSVNNHYAAVWFALHDISPDAGPFEFIPGSHRWPALRRDKVLRYVPPQDRTGEWPKTSEGFICPLLEREIARREATATQFLAAKGDVLIWNGHLTHRGAAPRDPTLLRKAIITHYSSIHRRKDAPAPAWFEGGGYFF